MYETRGMRDKIEISRAEISKTTKKASEKCLTDFPKVSAMDRDPRGLPIPANVTDDTKNGKPNLGVRNAVQEIELFCAGKCSVTGTFLDVDDVWFVTTPDLAFVPFGLLMDAPMCCEAKDFTLQVCPYFGISNYIRLTDKQAKAMVPNLSIDSPKKSYTVPSEFVAVKVAGFRADLIEGNLRYLPSRHYTRIEFWKERNCQRVIEGQKIREEIIKGCEKASSMLQPEKWPAWTKISLDGSLNGYWPWTQPEAKEALMQAAIKRYIE